MSDRRSSRYAEKNAGASNKFYEVKVEELDNGQSKLYFTYGRIGTEGRTLDQGAFGSYEYAVQVGDEQFEKKLAKGYKEVTAMQAIASAVETLEERKTNGLEPVEIDVPRFHAGTSEARCKKFCEKWLAKLNLVRASRWDLGDSAYSKQITSVLKGYCKEWTRITNTKAHGHLAENVHAQTAFRIFFGSLKDNTKTYVYGYFQGVGNSY